MDAENSACYLSVGYFKLARNISKLSEYRVQVGAVLAKKVPLMACANKLVSHPKFANGNDHRTTLHAEMRCLLHTQHSDREGSVIYVYRETKDQKPALARPCAFCMEALKEAGVKKVFFSTNKFPFYGCERI
jgi:deoxycytidylate deaminase